MCRKISDLYLMKIYISFLCGKNFKSVFNENIDMFLCAKKFQIYI